MVLERGVGPWAVEGKEVASREGDWEVPAAPEVRPVAKAREGVAMVLGVKAWAAEVAD